MLARCGHKECQSVRAGASLRVLSSTFGLIPVLQVDIGLIEAVEQNSHWADLIERFCKIGQVAEKKTQLGETECEPQSLLRGAMSA